MIDIKRQYQQIKDTYNSKTFRNKMQTNGPIAALNRKWSNRKIEHHAKKLQQAADNDDMKPLWGYRKQLKTTQSRKRHPPLK